METNKKETFEVELFIHAKNHSEGFDVTTFDMSENGYVLLGTQTVTLNVPTKDPVEAEIEMLDKKQASLIKDHLAALHAIQCRKNDLLCLENKYHDPDDILSTLNTEVNE
jgi:hypothetical protein